MLRKSQSAVEYAVTIACVAAALVVMQSYVRRGLSGKIKSLTDSNLGAQFDPTSGDFRSVTAQIGDTVEVTRIQMVEQAPDPRTGVRFVDWHEYVYSVTGPQSMMASDGVEVIPEDWTRQPLRVSSYQDSSVDWENLSGSGGSGGSGGIVYR